MNDTPFQNLSDLPEALAARGLDPALHRQVLEHLRRHMERYADLEKTLLGHVWVTVPAHLLDLDLPEEPLEAGEVLAARERERFGLGEGEAGDVMSLFDREGLKVYRPRFPNGSEVDGLFLFDREVGPVLAVDGRLPAKEGDFVFARLYAHYLVDNDPYEIRFVVRGPDPERAPEELRAQAFAAAFLISRVGLRAYLDALGHREGDPVTADMLRQLAVYFEVGFRPLLTRLLSMGLLAAQDLRPLLEDLEPAAAPPEPAPPGAVGERFTRLALEAHARKLLTDEQLAVHLETDEESALDLAARFRLEDGEPSAAGENATPPDGKTPDGKTPDKGSGGKEGDGS